MRHWSERFSKVVELARKHHAGQYRKGGCIPYIEHPISVASMLERCGVVSDEELCTAICHDLFEDTACTAREIINAAGGGVLGEVVVRNVECLTRISGEPKNEYIRRVVSNGTESQILVKCADRICNTSDFVSIGMSEYARSYLSQAKSVFYRLRGIDRGGVLYKEYEKLSSMLGLQTED